MINGSTAFNNAVNTGGYPYTIRMSENGTIIDCEVFACSVYKGTTGNEAFGIGTVFVPYVELEISSISTPLENKELLIECGVQISSTQTEWINLGYFKVTKNNGSTIKSTITAVGRIASTLSTLVPTLTTPTTIASVIQDIQTSVRTVHSGFTINTSSVDITGGEITEDVTGRNCRQLLELVTGLIGGFATEDNNGNVVIFKYGSNVVDYSGTRMTAHPIVSNSDFILDNIKVIQSEESTLDDGTIVPEVSYQYDESTSPKIVIINSYMASQTMFNKFCTNCIGLTYRPATIVLASGDPRIEASDVLRITDTDGSIYRVPAMSLVHTLTGGLTSTIITPGETTTETESTVQGPITQRVDLLTSSVASAQTSAELARAAVELIQIDVDRATDLLDAMEEAAEQADTTLTQIYQDAVGAKLDADRATESAITATTSATNALNQLSIVENVVGVLDLLSKHGTYTLTTDTEAQNGKWYFERSGSGTTESPYVYLVVNLSEGDNPTGYYELSDIDEAITNYVSSHLALTDDGLSLQQDGSDYRLLISTEGLKIIGLNGATVASYGTNTRIGDPRDFHITMTNTALEFWQGTEDAEKTNRVAYITNHQLYIEQSVVLQQMDLGISANDGGDGQWSWKVHKNVNGQNNLNLKWIG